LEFAIHVMSSSKLAKGIDVRVTLLKDSFADPDIFRQIYSPMVFDHHLIEPFK
jgi:hypothetical protein